MNRKALLAGLTFLILLAVGCSKSKDADMLDMADQPQNFSIAETNTVVAEADIPQVPQTRIVRADFNMDSLEDIAVAEDDDTDPDRQSITIYLRTLGDDMETKYYRAGGIQQAGKYAITALMSRKDVGYTDLLVIFTFQNGRKQMVHFRSDGKMFTEILREEIGTSEPADSK